MQKSNMAGSALILVAALMGAAAYAQDVMPGDGMGPKGVGALFDFATLDADKDGKVTKAELEAAHTARVKAVDVNGDGKLSAEELAQLQITAMTARITEHAAQMVAALDSDGDGLLTAAELATRPGPEMMFDKLDTDGDGAISQAEADAARQDMQDMRGKRGHGGKGGHGQHGRHGGGNWGMFGGDDDMGGMGAGPEGSDQGN